MSKIISFRGKLDCGAQEKIKLSTLKGKVGYKIIKFETMPDTPGTNQTESMVKIYNEFQSSVDALVDFDDYTMLAARFQAIANGSNESYATALETIFDNAVTNQDIFITAIELTAGRPTNYYIELETMALSSQQATQLTLQSIRTLAEQ